MKDNLLELWSELNLVMLTAMVIFVVLELIMPRVVLAHLNFTYFFIFWVVSAILQLVIIKKYS